MHLPVCLLDQFVTEDSPFFRRFDGPSGCILTRALRRSRSYSPGVDPSTSRHRHTSNQSHGPSHKLFRWGGLLQWVFVAMFPLLWITIPSIYDGTGESGIHHFFAGGKRFALGWGTVEFKEPEDYLTGRLRWTFPYSIFSQPTTEVSVHDELFQLRQADSSIHEYMLRFRTLAASSGWNEVALLSAYRRGLNPALRQQMSIYDDSVGFERFLQKAARISQRLTACHMESMPIATASPSRSLPIEEPMITDNYHLSTLERSRRLTQGLCLYCGSTEHQLRACPVRPPRPAVSTIQIAPDVSNMSLVDALLRYHNQPFPVKILIDSGNFISSRTLAGFKIPRCRNDTTYQITTVQGKPLGKGLVRHRTPEVSLLNGCFHIERISLLVLEEAVVDVILGCPWLSKHQPTIDWRSRDILKWNSGCKQGCLKDLPVPISNHTSLSICSTTMESPETRYARASWVSVI